MAVQAGKKERGQIAEILNRHYNTYLWPVPGFEKWFQDDSGRNYVVLIGSQNRHYIARDTLEDEASSQREGILTIGRIEGGTTHVFLGSLRPLADNVDDLLPPHARDAMGFYRFMYEEDQRGRLRLTGKGGRAGRGGYLGRTLTRLEKIGDIGAGAFVPRARPRYRAR